MREFAGDTQLGDAVDSLEEQEALQRDPDRSEHRTMAFTTCFNWWSAPKWPGSWIRGSCGSLPTEVVSPKSVGPDEMRPRVPRELADGVAEPLFRESRGGRLKPPETGERETSPPFLRRAELPACRPRLCA